MFGLALLGISRVEGGGIFLESFCVKGNAAEWPSDVKAIFSRSAAFSLFVNRDIMN